jgi:hypothetical protein
VKSIFPQTIAWEYGPMAAGALEVEIFLSIVIVSLLLIWLCADYNTPDGGCQENSAIFTDS